MTDALNSAANIRNIAIVAHVDHGKTTLVDQFLRQSGTLNERTRVGETCIMDSNELEKQRGITILAKITAVTWQGYRINIIDTPGHADFGGEVERVLSMADSVLLLVDAVEGPMPQTRFVTQKAFAHGLRPILVINKVDRPGGKPNWVIDQVFDLFCKLGATDEQLDFPIVYASGLNGYATLDLGAPSSNMDPLFQLIVDKVPPPSVDPTGLFQMQISALDYSSYVGTIGIGRITRGKVKKNDVVTIIDREGKTRSGRILQIFHTIGLERQESLEAVAGDIIAVSGIETLKISDTLCDPTQVEALPPLTVDEPTIEVTFAPSNSPFVGKDGKLLTSRQIWDRLQEEALHNVALHVAQAENREQFQVAGRGELHLGILMETMRREGYEFSVSRPMVILKEVDGQKMEPYEELLVEVNNEHQGAVMELLGDRRGRVKNMLPMGDDRVQLEYLVPAQSLFGLHTRFMQLTSGTGLFHHAFDHYGPCQDRGLSNRKNGVMISNCTGKTTAYALFSLQERGQMLVGPQTEVYEGMIVGIHSRENDIVVNPCRPKQLTNIRASGSDENIILTPPIQFTLEQALGFIEADELVEVTPKNIRLRKRHLSEQARKQHRE